MKPIRDLFGIGIELTTRCKRGCVYCLRYTRHLRPDQLWDIPLDELDSHLQALDAWPKPVFFSGAEPLLHPQIEAVLERIGRFTAAGHRTCLFTSGGPRWKELEPLVRAATSYINFNEHSPSERQVCAHQPLTVAIGEAVEDEAQRNRLIDDCWMHDMWTPIITRRGFYHCDAAGSLSTLLGGPDGLPVEHGVWDRPLYDFLYQIKAFCHLCGAACPMPRQKLCDPVESFSPGLLALFRQHGLYRLGPDDVRLVRVPFTREEIEANKVGWTPWANRG